MSHHPTSHGHAKAAHHVSHGSHGSAPRAGAAPSKAMAGLRVSAPTTTAAASSSSSSSGHTSSTAASSPAHREVKRDTSSSASASAAGAGAGAGASTHLPVTGGPVNLARRRLSVMSGDPTKARETLDGAGTAAEEAKETKRTPTAAPAKKRAFSKWAAASKVGYVPFNPHKVNQDRYCEVTPFGSSDEKAVFGVFDGHGAVGHEVSSFVATELPNYILRQKNLDTEPTVALTKAFVDCNTRLAKDSIDCSFSGSTGILVYMNGKSIYSCNAGDSRAVLGKRTAAGTIKAVPLSVDHKPDRPDERKRILEAKGRVEACKGSKGEDVGPARVWLLHQDVPGLAMTRSFGDLVAATVGVIAKPEVFDRQLEEGDTFMILASDGVWEFIDSQEACDLIARAPDPQTACQILVEESVKRWNAEEEVVDDITALVVFF